MSLNDIINNRNVGPDADPIIQEAIDPAQQFIGGQNTLGSAQKVAVDTSQADMYKSLAGIAANATDILKTSGEFAIESPQTKGEQTREAILYNKEVNHLMGAETAVHSIDHTKTDKDGNRWLRKEVGVNPNTNEPIYMQWNLTNPDERREAQHYVFNSYLENVTIRSKRGINEHSKLQSQYTTNKDVVGKREQMAISRASAQLKWGDSLNDHPNAEQAWIAFSGSKEYLEYTNLVDSYEGNRNFVSASLNRLKFMNDIEELRSSYTIAEGIHALDGVLNEQVNFLVEASSLISNTSDPAQRVKIVMDALQRFGLDTTNRALQARLGIDEDNIKEGGVVSNLVSNLTSPRNWNHFLTVVMEFTLDESVNKASGTNPNIGLSGTGVRVDKLKDLIIRDAVGRVTNTLASGSARASTRQADREAGLQESISRVKYDQDPSKANLANMHRSGFEPALKEWEDIYRTAQQGGTDLGDNPSLDDIVSNYFMGYLARGVDGDWLRSPELIEKTYAEFYTGFGSYHNLSHKGIQLLGNNSLAFTTVGDNKVLTLDGARLIYNQKENLKRDIRGSTWFTRTAAAQLDKQLDEIPQQQNNILQMIGPIKDYIGMMTDKDYSTMSDEDMIRKLGILGQVAEFDEVRPELWTSLGITDLRADAEDLLRETIFDKLKSILKSNQNTATQMKKMYGEDNTIWSTKNLGQERLGTVSNQHNLMLQGNLSSAQVTLFQTMSNALVKDGELLEGEEYSQARIDQLEHWSKELGGFVSIDQLNRSFTAWEMMGNSFNMTMGLLRSQGITTSEVTFGSEVYNMIQPLNNFTTNPKSMWKDNNPNAEQPELSEEYVYTIASESGKLIPFLYNIGDEETRGATESGMVGNLLNTWFDQLEQISEVSDEDAGRVLGLAALTSALAGVISGRDPSENKNIALVKPKLVEQLDENGNLETKFLGWENRNIETPTLENNVKRINNLLTISNQNTMSGRGAAMAVINAGLNLWAGRDPAEIAKVMNDPAFWRPLVFAASNLSNDGDHSTSVNSPTSMDATGKIEREDMGHANLAAHVRTISDLGGKDSLTPDENAQVARLFQLATGQLGQASEDYLEQMITAVAQHPFYSTTETRDPITGKMMRWIDVVGPNGRRLDDVLQEIRTQRASWDKLPGDGWAVEDIEGEDALTYAYGGNPVDQLILDNQGDTWYLFDGLDLYGDGPKQMREGAGFGDMYKQGNLIMAQMLGELSASVQPDSHALSGSRGATVANYFRWNQGQGEAGNEGDKRLFSGTIPSLLNTLYLMGDINAGSLSYARQNNSGNSGIFITDGSGGLTLNRDLDTNYALGKHSVFSFINPNSLNRDVQKWNKRSGYPEDNPGVSPQESMYHSWALSTPPPAAHEFGTTKPTVVGEARLKHVMSLVNTRANKAGIDVKLSPSVVSMLTELASDPDVPNLEYYMIANTLIADSNALTSIFNANKVPDSELSTLLMSRTDRDDTSGRGNIPFINFNSYAGDNQAYLAINVNGTVMNLMALPPDTFNKDPNTIQKNHNIMLSNHYRRNGKLDDDNRLAVPIKDMSYWNNWDDKIKSPPYVGYFGRLRNQEIKLSEHQYRNPRPLG